MKLAPGDDAARGILLREHRRPEQARQALATAAALGARKPESYDSFRLFLFRPPGEW